MKYLSLTGIFILFYFSVFGQAEAEKFKDQQLKNSAFSKDELKSELTKFDFSGLLTHTDNSVVYGFIGDDYKRLRMKFITIIKDTGSKDTYIIYGKSMVRTNIDEFHGTLTITNIRRQKVTSFGVDDEYKNKGIKGEYVILGDYRLSENKDQPHSGRFNGVFELDFYLDKKNKVKYDDIDMTADGYTNNQFVGQWTAYEGNLVKRCNWGDFRIPNSGDFDIGAGDFSPADKYLKNGWQSVRDLMTSNPSNKKAKLIEEQKWWQ